MAVINVNQINEFNTNLNDVKNKMTSSLQEIIDVYKRISGEKIMSSSEIDAIIQEIQARVNSINDQFDNLAREFYKEIMGSSDFAEEAQKRAEELLPGE